uniref:Uncharacterized protein n=1 Tax=Arundo donax TaxID=35708 RepID=A0A0A9DCP6_ARUDO
MSRMEFSTVDLPFDYDKLDVAIVEAAEGMLGIFSHTEYDTSLYLAIQQNEGENANDCQMETVIPLSRHKCYIIGVAEGYIFLGGFPKVHRARESCFLLEIKTLKIVRVSRRTLHSPHIPYFGFPPSLSLRWI